MHTGLKLNVIKAFRKLGVSSWESAYF